MMTLKKSNKKTCVGKLSCGGVTNLLIFQMLTLIHMCWVLNHAKSFAVKFNWSILPLISLL
jgi:hypothetical protein